MIWNAILLAIGEIRRNVLRSFLTILGIVIGVASVITMVTLGGGVTAKVEEQISSMGSNMLMINPGKRMGPMQSSGAAPFKLEDCEAIAKSINSIVAVAPSSSSSLTVVFGNENWSSSVTGTDNNFFKVRNRNLQAGRQFNDSELRSGTAVCIIGDTVRKKLFGGQNPLDTNIRLGKFSCKVVGLLDMKGQSSMGPDQDDLVLVPIRTFHRRISGNRDISMIQVSVRSGESTSKVQADIERLMRERRHIAYNEDDNFSVMDMKEISTMLTSTTQVLTALLSAVAAVSLLVGGIGIMNIMLVSVTERTREIGTRLAIGALEREVMMQFLVESVVLSLLGGTTGILLGLTGSFALKNVLQVPFILNIGIVIVAFLFSAAVGMVFGYFPALKAARLDPIVALRHE